jgi:hypothetical protein
VNGSIDASTTQQRRFGGVDNAVDLNLRHVADPERNFFVNFRSTIKCTFKQIPSLKELIN